jgi:hypothetical protein
MIDMILSSAPIKWVTQMLNLYHILTFIINTSSTDRYEDMLTA